MALSLNNPMNYLAMKHENKSRKIKRIKKSECVKYFIFDWEFENAFFINNIEVYSLW